ncbi:MAG: glycosyltransferase family 1 protein [Magnetococcales bacterium]|nr:glycosyltransferase family 1 protein [Magnetococcales bacterium]
MKSLRCLITRFRAFHYYEDLARACIDNGMEVASEYGETAADIEGLRERIDRFRPDFILNHPLFSEHVARVGAEKGIPVFHWMVDKIVHKGRFCQIEFFDTDHILSTYLHDVDHLKERGVRADYFLNACNIDPVDYSRDRLKYGVGFVGTIELGENNYYRQFIAKMRENCAGLSPDLVLVTEKLIQFFDEVLQLQQESSKNFHYILPYLEKTLFQNIEGIFSFQNDKGVSTDFNADDMVAVLVKETSHLQRRHFFQAIPHLDAFGPEDWTRADLPNVHYRGLCDQYRESGHVFASSRINLAVSRIYSLDGLSDRIFNVLFAGGFLLANRQESLARVFHEGVELESYATVEELLDKIRFYENNTLARQRIARAGRENVLKNHMFKNRMGELLRLLH